MTGPLSRVTPAAAATYLARTGWSRMGERNAGTVWTKPLDGGFSHLFQPEDPASPDYAQRIGELIAAMAVAEGRAEPDVLTDLCIADDRADQPAEVTGRATRRTDWMEPEFGLRRPELALVLDLAACRIERQAFVLELERLQWPLGEAAELADLVAECELVTAESVTSAGWPVATLAKELAEFALDAAAQGSGNQPLSPCWHNFISTWEDADELFRRPEFQALLTDETRAALVAAAAVVERTDGLG